MFDFVDNVKNSVFEIYKAMTTTKEAPKFTLELNHEYLSGKTVVLDLSWYAPYKTYGDTVICLFVYIAFIWHVFKVAPGIISGSSGANSTFEKLKESASNGSSFNMTRNDL